MVARSLDLTRLRAEYLGGALTVFALAEELLARIDTAGDDHVWINRVPRDELLQRATAQDRMAAADPAIKERLPLFGVPFAVKDNIDAAGLATTAACPAFSYVPERDATSVKRLLAAGALLIGKTNLDQFATGLVGVRSPYGVARNPFDARYIPGGSSSGSAVAVASGLVSFALGTDTAGSGRVPAAFNNLVGLKPTKGLISARGVVPACASLDCVSIFGLTVDDAERVLTVAAGFDAEDHFSRRAPEAPHSFGESFRFGVPRPEDLEFFGDSDAAALYRNATATLEELGGTKFEFSLAPFLEAAKLLYDGPWVAERMAAVEKIFREQPDAILPVTRAIIGGADRFNAVDTFKAQYRLGELRRGTEPVWDKIDAMILPSAPTVYTVEQVNADPVVLNSRLGRYTNFVNLLDLAALAIPAGFRGDGLPFGVTLVAPAFRDYTLASLGRRFTNKLDLPLGASNIRRPPTSGNGMSATGIPVAVFGAHLSGMPLNHQLREHGATLIDTVATAPRYRMFELAGEPPRPGVVRVAPGMGRSLEAELWSLSSTALGHLVVATSAPLTIGTLELADGTWVKGFLCEAQATAARLDISDFGGWRKFVTHKADATRGP